MPVYFEGKRKKVRYGRDLVEVRFGKKTKKEAFAVFSADDGSLNFYKRVDVPKVGEQFEGKTVAAVYTGIEKSKFTNINEVPWVKEYQSITKCIVVDEIKPMSTAFWFALTYMTVCDVSKLDTTSTYDMWNMFMGALRLYELKLGKNFTWQGEQCYPPIQTAGFVPNADGKWYAASDGKGYTPENIPSNKADTYYAYPPQAFAVYSDDDKSLNFYKRFGVPKALEQFDGRTATEVYTGIENISDSEPLPWNAITYSVRSVNVVDVIHPVSTVYWFGEFGSCRTMNLKNLKTDKVVDMTQMFFFCRSLTTIDLSSFDTSNVEIAEAMFSDCNNLTSLNLSNFNTDKMWNFCGMFDGCESIKTLNIANFNNSLSWGMGGWSDVFTNCNNLREIVIGDRLDFFNHLDSLPIPDPTYIPNANGKWYSMADGRGYVPSEIPSNKADTYYAYPPSYKYTEIRRITARAMETTGDTFISISKAKRYRASLTLNPPSGGIGRNIMSVHIYDTNSGSQINTITVDRYNVQYFELQPGDYRMYGFFDCQTSGYQGTLILEEEIGFEFAPIN